MPKISILTAAYINTYDRLAWLTEAIRSVQAQSFEDWEMIIIDDASPFDLSGLKIEFYGDPRLRWFRNAENSGPSLARNTAAALAEAGALLPLDADDLLAGDALAALYDAWAVDPGRVVYGNLQRLSESGERGRIFDLPDYTFQRALDLKGIMPVTALHSIEAHLKAGGWKKELKDGLEDVEYWISAGKAGYCGHKVASLILLYRKHEHSRHSMLQANRLETQTGNKIIDMHRDVYEGRYPMGCCGGGTGYIPPQQTGNQQQMSIAATLEGYPPDQKTWVQYLGKRSGAFDMVGDHTGKHYNVRGPGYKFEIHILDAPKFRRSGRSLDFAIGAAPPVEIAPVVAEVAGPPPAYQAPAPELSRIERLDEIAARSRQALPVQNGGQPESRQGEPDFDLSPLGLPERVRRALEMESWSIQKLAGASIDDLIPYPGIGSKVASQVIEKARSHLNV